jgi:hypothetical protein
MKKLVLLPLAAACLAIPAMAHEDHDMADVTGTSAGSYTCVDGEHGFFLNLGKTDMTDTGAWQIIGKPVVPGFPAACDALIATQFLPAVTE